ncbi:efflux transporter outer membrane subunit [Thiolapillus sp.]
MKSCILLLAAALLALSGCSTLGPDYEKPEVPVPDNWRVPLKTAEQISNIEWWKAFGDPVLNDLVEEALAHNQDLRVAAARLLEYAARVDVARAGLYPQLGYGVNASRLQASRNSLNGVPAGNSRVGDDFLASLNVGWELDFWGRIARSTEAARANLLAAEYGRRSVILSVVSAVATGYLSLRSLDRQLEIARATLARRGESVALFEEQFRGGVISELELAQVRSEYQAAAVLIPTIERQIAQTENALSLLIGRNPGEIARGKAVGELVLPGIPADIPSEVLQRRPDILQAEQNLVAANALIGVARAEYFPHISLSGMLGLASADLSSLLNGASGIWNLGAAAGGTIFSGGAVDAQVRISEAARQQALHAYIRTVQTAFVEVNDALIASRKSREILAAVRLQVEASHSYARFAQMRYEEGYVSYMEVLDAERSLFDAELDYTRKEAEVHAALVAVYKALGGGWVTDLEQELNRQDFAAKGKPADEWKERLTPEKTSPFASMP